MNYIKLLLVKLYKMVRKMKIKCNSFLLLLFFVLILCSCGTKRNLQFGSRCQNDYECKSSLCVSLSKNADYGLCTKSCTTGDDCPEGYSCTGLTNKGIVICQPGAANPFGVER